ncbi:MAG TPA: Ig-like domain-containing protein [Leptospiraceae bacterium]|nr:Ig-like domain-containing protein [Leptospiraceae bacterium]HNM03058.1 Ig-like domain-containing protein [Leptospiraceae bacterium]
MRKTAIRKLFIIILILIQSGCGVLFWKSGKGKQGLMNWMPLALVGQAMKTNGSVQAKSLPSSINEGETLRIDIVLSSDPQKTVPVIASSNSSSILINNQNAAYSTLDSSNFRRGLSFSIKAAEDDNVANEIVQIEIAAEGYQPLAFALEIKDNDVQRIILSKDRDDVQEGKKKTFEVRLNIKPEQTVSVQLENSDPSAVSISPAVLKFEPSNYNIPQTVTVEALEDADSVSETSFISVGADNLEKSVYTVKTLDNDKTLLFSLPSLSVNEGSVQQVNVSLSEPPEQETVIYFSSSRPSSIQVNPASVTVNPYNWNLPIILDVSALQDANYISEAAVISASSVLHQTASLNVSSVDDEVQAILVSGATTVTEGSNGIIKVRLAQPPTGTISVNLSSSYSKLQIANPVLYFTPLNYSTDQNVTLVGQQDADKDSSVVSITASTPGITSAVYPVIFLDNDTGIQITPSAPSIREGSSGSMQVVLNGDPGIPRTVNLSSSLPSLSLGSVILSFDSSNWNIPQTVSLLAVEDIDHNSDIPSVSGSGTGLISTSSSITVFDNDTRAVITGSSSVYEGGSILLNVQLSGNPINPVSVTATSSNTSASTVSPGTLNFTSANWNVNQSLTVTGISDANSTGITSTISFSESSLITVNYPVKTIDRETILFDPTSDTNVVEGGTAKVRIKLAEPPPYPAAFTVSSSNAGSVSVSPSVLNFNSGNYNTYQEVTLTGRDDSNNTSENPVSIGFSFQGISESWNVSVTDKYPVITSFTPADTSSGTNITIYGSNFFPSPSHSQNVVNFNGGTGTVTSATAGSINVTISPSGTSGPITVTTPRGSSTSGANFTYYTPTVISTSPSHLAQSVQPAGTNITVNFNVTLNPATVVLGSTFKVQNAGVDVPGSLIKNATSVTFVPSAEFDSGTVYSVTVTTGILDVANFSLASNYTFSFTTKYFSTQISGTGGNENVYDITLDDSGNVYIVGATNGNLDGQTGNGGWTGFVKKYDKYGNPVWTRLYNDAGYISKVIYDTGNLYVLTDNSLKKLDLNGNEVWNYSISVYYYNRDFAVDSSGIYYIYTSRWCFFSCQQQRIISKIDKNSNLLFTDLIESTGEGSNFLYDPMACYPSYKSTYQYGTSKIVAENAKIYASGINSWLYYYAVGSCYKSYYFQDSLGISARSPSDGSNLTGNGFSLGTGVAYVSSGNQIYGFAVDNSENSYIAYENKVVKYAGSTVVWTQTLNSAMSVRNMKYMAGKLYLTGITDTSLSVGGAKDIFYMEMDTSGNILNTMIIGSSANDAGRSLAVDSAGNVYLTGETVSSLNGQSFFGGTDIFLMKFDNAGNVK